MYIALFIPRSHRPAPFFTPIGTVIGFVLWFSAISVLVCLSTYDQCHWVFRRLSSCLHLWECVASKYVYSFSIPHSRTQARSRGRERAWEDTTVGLGSHRLSQQQDTASSWQVSNRRRAGRVWISPKGSRLWDRLSHKRAWSCPDSRPVKYWKRTGLGITYMVRRCRDHFADFGDG